MAVSIKLRLYDFPSKAVTELQSIVCKDMDIDGKFLFEQIADLLKVSSSQLTLIFCGRHIKPHTRLKATNFRSGHLVQVLYKPVESDISLLDVDAKRLKVIMAGLHLILCGRRQDHRKLKKNVVKLLTDTKRLQKIIESVPGLSEKPITTDILRHPDIFSHVVEPSNFDKILDSNKHLGAAIILVWDNTPSLKSMKDILSAATNNRQARVSPRDEYDEEDMDTEQTFPTTSRQAQGGNSSGIITSDQLSQALSLANSPLPGRIFPSPMGSTPHSEIQSPQSGNGSSTGDSRTRTDSGQISADVFSLAMQQALAPSNTSATPPEPGTMQSDSIPTLSREAIEKGMEHLRSMGIVDEAASREALIAAGGNVQAAVNILFASGMNDL